MKKERHEMEKKLKLYESKILQSSQNDGKTMAEQAAAREAFVQQKRVELESRYKLAELQHAPFIILGGV